MSYKLILNKSNLLFLIFVMFLISLFGMNREVSAAGGVPSLQQTVDSQTLQISGLEDSIATINSDIQNINLNVASQQIQLDVIPVIKTTLQSQELGIAALNNGFHLLNQDVDNLSTSLNSVTNDLNALKIEVASMHTIPPKDFAFFTNHPFSYGGYFMSPTFDANDYTKFSMTFTCTSHTNDQVKYWIETSADGVNWSPWGYYQVACNGIYSGASINSGSTPARYFAIGVQPISNNSHINTITSIGRFSN